MPETGARVDPCRNFNFLVELDGVAQAAFIECSGIEATTEVIETREGGDNATVRKLPGITRYNDITLRWGVTASDELWRWREQIILGIIARKNGSIVVFDLDNKRELVRWNFVNAWPARWEGPSMNATGSEVAVETLVLAHEGVTRP